MILHVRPIPSCPGYFVSDAGRVWGPQKELALGRHRRGYLYFAASRQRHGSRTAFVHHAVAEAFLGPKPRGAWVCHRNDDRSDNSVSNLYYGNASTNNHDTYRNGGRCNKGEGHPRAKLTWRQVRAIRQAYAAGAITQVALAREYGVNYRTVWGILHNLRWKEEIGK